MDGRPPEILTDSDRLAALIEEHEDKLVRRAMKLEEEARVRSVVYKGPLCECGKRGIHTPNWHCGFPA